MPGQEYVSVKQLSQELGLDSSNTRKYVLSQGFSFLKQRTPDSRGQLANVLAKEDAEAIKALREEQGFSGNVVANHTEGWFYVVQIVPELDPLRVKLGFASDAHNRLQAHRTVAPTAILVKAWPCKRVWEQAAMDSVTRTGCQLIASEVFQCDGLDTLIERCDSFFELMP
ncbi:MAG: hypothetical protein ABIH46_11665 [Chloroflexota bacterium]